MKKYVCAARNCHLTVDIDYRDGTLAVGYRHESDNATPLTIIGGHRKELNLRVETARADELQDVIEQLRPLVDRVHAGYSAVWDGHNLVAQLDRDATLAEEEIDTVYERLYIADAQQCAEAFFADGTGVTAETTDAELEEEAARAVANCDRDLDAHLDYEDALEYLTLERKSLRDRAADE